MASLTSENASKTPLISDLRQAITQLESINSQLETKNCQLSKVELCLERSQFNNAQLQKRVSELTSDNGDLEARLNGEEITNH